MKVLTMQLNSITIMDLVAYGGAALGMVLAVLEFRAGRIPFWGCFAVIFLSADFFLPMRQLGSFFHIAMNGMAASDKIFTLLDLPEDAPGSGTAAGGTLACRDLRFSAIVGESGCGKSTVASVLTGRCRGYTGSAALSGGEISALSADSLLRTVTYVGFSSYLFRGTVAENLRMARPDADDASLWDVLERVRLAGFLRGERGLDTPLDAQGANLSGGQRQRLALARALLHDSPVYVFDEATSNIDVESENDIMAEIRALARRRTVIVITHRLANVTDADSIYVLEAGTVAGHGPHAALLAQGGLYKTLWDRQQELEHFGTEEVSA